MLLGVSGNKAFFNLSVVHAQELVLGGDRAFLVQELVYRLVSGGLAQVNTDNLIQCLTQA